MRRKVRKVALDVRGLIDRDDIFRVGDGSKRDPNVEQWLNAEPAELRSIAKDWFSRMRACGPDVRESIHDECPVACIEDAPFAYVNTFKTHVNVGFFNGASLSDPTGLLEGSGKRMRHVKLRPGVDVDAESLRKLIDDAYSDIKARLKAERASMKK